MRAPGGSEGTILHADLDAFFASVEVRDNPALRGKPVIVGGGVVLACTYEARAHGVRTAMGGRQARRLCPDAVVVPARFSAYTEASQAVFAVFRNTTPQVEPLSIDEAFLDVSGLLRLRGQQPSEIGQQLRADVQREVGLPISVGIARTKYLAKIASGSAKPDGMLSIPLDSELIFLHALPVERLWGVGKVTAEKLHRQQIYTVGQLATKQRGDLVSSVGRAAADHLLALATGSDPRRVTTGVRRSSIGSQHALGGGHHDEAELQATVLAIVDRVARRLRAEGRTGSTVTLRLRFGDYTRSTSSRTLPRPTAHTEELVRVARQLLADRNDDIIDRGCTLVGISMSGLDHHSPQLALPLDPNSTPALDEAIDAVRNKFGADAMRRATHLHARRLTAEPSARGPEPTD